MEVHKKAWFEFLMVILLIIVAMVFAWNVNIGWDKKGPKPAPTPAEKDMVKENKTPESIKWHQGKNLFRSNCGACHNIKFDGTGPPLAGAIDRWKAAGSYEGKTGEEWMRAWIKNWNDPVKEGYKYAVNMANSRVQQMNVFTYLSDEDIDKILFYISAPEKYEPKAQ